MRLEPVGDRAAVAVLRITYSRVRPCDDLRSSGSMWRVSRAFRQTARGGSRRAQGVLGDRPVRGLSAGVRAAGGLPGARARPLGRYARRRDRSRRTRTNCAAPWPTCCPPRRSRCRCTRAATPSWRRWTGWCASAPGAPGCAAGRRWRSWPRQLPAAGAGRGAAAGGARARPPRTTSGGASATRTPGPGSGRRSGRCRCAGSCSSPTRSGEYEQGRRREPAGAALPDADGAGAAAGGAGAAGAAGGDGRGAARSTAWWTSGAGWRSSIRARWSSWTTAGWCMRCRRRSWTRTTRRRMWRRGSTALRDGDGDAGRARRTGGSAERWRAVRDRQFAN